MGQAQSSAPQAQRTHEELVHELARRFADKCFTPIEIYSLKDVFKQLADTTSSIRYLSADTIACFLEIPDILGAGPVLFQMLSFLAAFPFLEDAPAVIGLDQLVILIVLLTERYKKVLRRGAVDRNRLLFKSLAVYDRLVVKQEEDAERARQKEREENGVARSKGFAIDAPVDDEDDEDDEDADFDDDYDDDNLVLAALESLSVASAIHAGDKPSRSLSTRRHGIIPPDNFKHLVMLLLLVAPLSPQESVSQYAAQLLGQDGEGLKRLTEVADSVVAAFVNAETVPGVRIGQWQRALGGGFPNLFDGVTALFEHFLFSKNLDFSRVKRTDSQITSTETSTSAASAAPEDLQPILPSEGEIMCIPIISQLSFFLPGTSLFRRLRPLYAGAHDGFSMGSFETKVFNWRAPTILLVRGTRLASTPQSVQEATFASSISARRFPAGSKGDRLTFGVYIGTPWKHTHRECFGESDSVLFQLEPVHDVFPASRVNREYVSFTKAPGATHTLAFGCPHPAPSQTGRGSRAIGALGAVSLRLDAGLEFGVFHHDYTAKGGAFANSEIRRFDFQDRFEIESLEVWGCGGDEEAKVQAERWAWEAREAEARRRINLGTGDIEADRALLEMAGLIEGANRSGGSMM